MLKKMASKFILLLGIFFVVATNVFSYDEDLKIGVNYANPTVPSVAFPLATVPTPPSPVNAPPNQSLPPAETPTPPPTQPPVSSPAPPPTSIVKSWKDCIPLCFYRCKLHLRKILCVTACMTCCDRCKCVPPGIYGNREKCGKCYTDMLTHRNKFKCP